ncbi:MAG: hypothetical protein CSA15_10835, partial [Candidatus Delongbacteria bacterium]
TLTVPVTVSDGTSNSNPFDLIIEVTNINDAPVITGQSPDPIVIAEDTPFDIVLGNLTVTDPDNTYPDGFTLAVSDGANYTVSDNTITPSENYTGQLTVPVTVNDGTDDSDSFNVIIVVTAVDDEIVVNSILPPAGSTITITEEESKIFSIDAFDPDGNSLSYSWKLDGNEVSTDSIYTYVADYTSAGEYTVTLTVTDESKSRSTLNYSWNLIVTDVNRPMVLNSIEPEVGNQAIQETDSINFVIDIFDPDSSNISYEWKKDDIVVSDSNTYLFDTDYTSAGEYTVTLKVVEDGYNEERSFSWLVMVSDKNQLMVLNSIEPEVGTYTIQETDSINFVIDIFDPDSSNISYEWKKNGTIVSESNTYLFDTDYTSAGEYTVILEVVEDGYNETLTFTWTVIVTDVAQGIVVNGVIPPAGSTVTITEEESKTFSIDAFDPDGNPLSYSWKLDGNEVSTDSIYTYVADYTSAGEYLVTLDVTNESKRKENLSYNWTLIVTDVDQPILVNNVEPSQGGSVTINETEVASFSISASDPDGNALSYSWKLDGNEVSTDSIYTYVSDYTSAGEYLVTLDVTDNYGTKNAISYEWNLIVLDVEQNISVNGIEPPNTQTITISETDSISFAIDASDPGGNTLFYTWILDGSVVSSTNSYNYVTDYNSAGAHDVKVIVSNEEKSTLFVSWSVNVLDVDQPISVNGIEPSQGGNVTINETEVASFSISAFDPDGNALSYSWKLDGNEVSTTPGYNYISDYTSAGEYTVTLDVTDNYRTRNAISYEWNLIVLDVDQSIVASYEPNQSNVVINENSDPKLFKVNAVDPDGNEITYSWFIKRVGEDYTSIGDLDNVLISPTFNPSDGYSAGDYKVKVVLNDNFGSKNETMNEWNLTINNVDRAPQLDPIEPAIVKEGETYTFFLNAIDPDEEGDVVSYSTTTPSDMFTLNSETGEVVISPSMEDYDNTPEGGYQFTFKASSISNYNGVTLGETTQNMELTVVDVNEPLEITLFPEVGDIEVSETDSIYFEATVTTNDIADNVTYSWKLDGNEVSTGINYLFETSNNSSGEYLLELTISDNHGLRDYDEPSVSTFVWNIKVNDTFDDHDIIVGSNLFYPGSSDPKFSRLEFNLEGYTNPKLLILTLKGKTLDNLKIVNNTAFWNGDKKDGKKVGPGTYLYQLEADGVKKYGFIGLIR